MTLETRWWTQHPDSCCVSCKREKQLGSARLGPRQLSQYGYISPAAFSQASKIKTGLLKIWLLQLRGFSPSPPHCLSLLLLLLLLPRSHLDDAPWWWASRGARRRQQPSRLFPYQSWFRSPSRLSIFFTAVCFDRTRGEGGGGWMGGWMGGLVGTEARPMYHAKARTLPPPSSPVLRPPAFNRRRLAFLFSSSSSNPVGFTP